MDYMSEKALHITTKSLNGWMDKLMDRQILAPCFVRRCIQFVKQFCYLAIGYVKTIQLIFYSQICALQ